MQLIVFFMPYFGVLAQIHPEIALEVLHRDCLIRIATSVSLTGKVQSQKSCAILRVDTENEREIFGGELVHIPNKNDTAFSWKVQPRRGIDAGAGPGEPVSGSTFEGSTGLIIDARGRPLVLPEEDVLRRETLTAWHDALKVYTEEEG